MTHPCDSRCNPERERAGTAADHPVQVSSGPTKVNGLPKCIECIHVWASARKLATVPLTPPKSEAPVCP